MVLKMSTTIVSRLISEMTVEENILKKANQKRLLGDMAIEGGNFTTEFFKEVSIKVMYNNVCTISAVFYFFLQTKIYFFYSHLYLPLLSAKLLIRNILYIC